MAISVSASDSNNNMGATKVDLTKAKDNGMAVASAGP